jgi:hypothetical protein
MKRLLLLSACALSLICTSASAQTPPSPGEPRANPVTFTEPFSDPGNEAARALAAQESISLGEATRRLRLMYAASRLARRLEERYGDAFGGVSVENQGARVVAHLRAGAGAPGLEDVRRETNDAELRGNLTLNSVPRSRRELRQLAQSLVGTLEAAGATLDAAINPADGSVVLLTPNPDALSALISSSGVAVPDFVRIEQFDGIETTADVYGGRAYNASTGLGCTTGFTVLRSADQIRGVSTAGHCDNTGKFSTSNTSTYSSSGQIALTFRQQWISNNLDIQWHTAGTGNVFPPIFWNGTSTMQVTGGQDDIPGTYLCKFGRTTLQTCGYVDVYEYYNGPYGYFSRVNKNATYPVMNDSGDSGGPVYSGSLAAGTVHGKDSSGNMYFMPLRRFVENNIGIIVLCVC